MRNSMLIGMAIGTILGAVMVEGNRRAATVVSDGKKAVKSKLDKLNSFIR